MKKSSLIGHTVELYGSILTSQKPPDHLIDIFFRKRKYLGSKDRRFIAETVYGMLRNKRKLEWIIDAIVSKDAEFYSCIAFLLLEKKESEDSLEKEVEIDRDIFSQLARRIHSLAQTLKDQHLIGLQYSFPEWMVRRWEIEYTPAEAENICSSLNAQAPTTLRVNTLKIGVDECERLLLGEGVETEPTPLSPFGLNLKKRVNVFQLQSFKKGFFEVQDEGSQLVSLLVDPKPGSKVVDACAGAGGKALAMASIMKNRGEIFALDPHTRRLDDLRKRVRRSGVDIIRVKPVTGEDIIPELEQSADFVLVDAPCSGTGTIRRNPGMKWSVSEEMIDEMHLKQASILSLNSRYVKPGGRLVYATCSLMKHENEEVVESFLSAHNGFELDSPSNILERYHLATLGNNKYFTLLPHRHNTDGFFGAVLKRK